MPLEPDTLPANPDATAHTPPPAAAEPDFVTRARRILSGDVRPDDYLATTPEVEAGVARDLAFADHYIRQEFEAGRIPAAFTLDPSVARRQYTERLLARHAGQVVVPLEDATGVIVLAIGLEACAALLNALPYETVRRAGLSMYTPEHPDTVSVY